MFRFEKEHFFAVIATEKAQAVTAGHNTVCHIPRTAGGCHGTRTEF